MTLTHYKRLLKLARHLERGKLYHEVFKYDGFSEGKMFGLFGRSCGCALGEAKVIFLGQRVGDSNRELNKWDVAGQLFGISQEEAGYLFAPCNISGSPNSMLPTATQYQVAAHIRKFVMDKLGVVRPKVRVRVEGVKTEPCPVCEGTGSIQVIEEEVGCAKG